MQALRGVQEAHSGLTYWVTLATAGKMDLNGAQLIMLKMRGLIHTAESI